MNTSPYHQIFRQTLTEQDLNPGDVSGDEAALNGSMDPSGDAGQYELDDEGGDPLEIIEKIKTRSSQWAQQVSDFTGFLNGTDPQSLINQVQSAGRHPAFEGIADQTKKDIGKVATTLAGLTEKIRGFINLANSTYDQHKAKQSGGG